MITQINEATEQAGGDTPVAPIHEQQCADMFDKIEHAGRVVLMGASTHQLTMQAVKLGVLTEEMADGSIATVNSLADAGNWLIALAQQMKSALKA